MKKQQLLAVALFLTGLSGALAQVSFTKITNGAIVADTGQFAAAGWGDFENRGLLDLIVAN